MTTQAILLVGAPGSGKTTMACTAPGKKLLIDMDAKASMMVNLRPMVESGELKVWECQAPLIQESLKSRLLRSVGEHAAPPAQEPRGFLEFASFCQDLDNKPEADEAAVWIVDSLTRVGEHLVRFISFHNRVPTLRPRDYGTYRNAMEEIVDKLKKAAISRGKHIIMTVHIRRIEVPTEDAKIIHALDRGKPSEEMVGTASLKVVPSLDGQIAEKLGGYFGEVYFLTAKPGREGVVKYLARTVPDEQSDARTSMGLDPFIAADLSKVLGKEAKG